MNWTCDFARRARGARSWWQGRDLGADRAEAAALARTSPRVGAAAPGEIDLIGRKWEAFCRGCGADPARPAKALLEMFAIDLIGDRTSHLHHSIRYLADYFAALPSTGLADIPTVGQWVASAARLGGRIAADNRRKAMQRPKGREIVPVPDEALEKLFAPSPSGGGAPPPGRSPAITVERRGGDPLWCGYEAARQLVAHYPEMTLRSRHYTGPLKWFQMAPSGKALTRENSNSASTPAPARQAQRVWRVKLVSASNTAVSGVVPDRRGGRGEEPMGCTVEQIWHGNPAAFRAVDRRGGRFRAYVPHPLAGWHPALPADAAASVAEAERDLRDTAEAAGQEGRGGHGMFFWAESLGSSRIEGVAPGTRRVVHALARRSRSPSDEPRGAVAEVVANIDAVEEALGLLADRDGFSADTVRRAHSVLMDASPTPHLGGAVRDEQNWVGGSDWHPLDPGTFVPPPAERCGPLLDDLAAYIRGDDHSPLLQAAVAHAQFETVHPFGDGNGRTGRAILYAALKHRLGLSDAAVMPPVSLALSRDRDSYLAALAAFQAYIGPAGGQGRADALAPLAESLTAASRRACRAVRAYSEAMGRLQDRWRAAVGGRRGRSAVSAAIGCLPAHPSLTPPSLAALTGYTEARCAAALRRLEEARVVKARTVGPNARVYDCDRVFDAYEIMSSTVCDPSASVSDYDTVIADPLVAPPGSGRRTGRDQTGSSGWATCPRWVKSTGLACSLPAGHGGHCRHLANRKHPPRRKAR